MEFDNLITSPFGFGESLILELLRKGESVYAVFPTPKDVPMSFLGKKNIKYGFLKLEHDPILEKTLPRRVGHVFHIFEAYNGKLSRLFKANALATLLLLDWAKAAGAQTFTYLSSGEVYGSGEDLGEGSAPDPHGYYATTKYQAEMLLKFYERALRINTVRVFFPFGRGLEQGYVYELANSIRSGEPFESHYVRVSPTFTGDIINPLIHIRDQKDGGTYNICGSKIDVTALGVRIGETLGRPAERVRVGKAVLTGSDKKAKERVGYVETELEAALAQSFEQLK